MGKTPHLFATSSERAPLMEAQGAKATEASLAEMLCALSFVADIGMGQRIEHGLRSAHIGLAICREAGLTPDACEAVFYGALLKDAGCTACATVFATFFNGDDLGAREECLLLEPDSIKDAVGWFWRHSPSDVMLPARMAKLFSFLAECRGVMKEGVAAHCEVGQMFAQRLGLPESVCSTVRYSWERWDGKGLAFGLKGADIPLAARILHVAQVVEAAYSFGTASAAEAIAKERRSGDFDPDIADTMVKLSATPGFWAPLSAESIYEHMMETRPQSAFDSLTADQSAGVCEVLADFADAKCRRTWNHSREVARVGGAIASAMGFDAGAAKDLRRAALVHDIGKAAVPVGILEKGDYLSDAESKRFRSHPQYTGVVLERVGPLRRLASVAAAHHEQLDGNGYPRGLRSSELDTAARALAVADRYVLQRAQVGDEQRTLDALEGLVGSVLDSECVDGLNMALTKGIAAPIRPAASHAGLSEREIEVLRLVAEGATAREVASKLVISRKTVEHHLENVYDKLGVTSKTAAAVFAVTNGLI